MTAIQHKYLTGVRAETDVQYEIVGSRRTRLNDLHIAQGELDGSCGLVAVLQCAMVLCGVKRKEVEDIASSRSGPLRAVWNLARRDYFKGTTDEELQRLISAFGPRLASKTVTGSRPRRIVREIESAIEAGHVPILGMQSHAFAHWVLVVGVEQQVSNSRSLALLCLDAGDSRPPWGVFYNARCALQASEFGQKRPKRYALRYATTEAVTSFVRLHSLVVVMRGQTP